MAKAPKTIKLPNKAQQSVAKDFPLTVGPAKATSSQAPREARKVAVAPPAKWKATKKNQY